MNDEKTDINVRQLGNATALFMAVRYGYEEMVDLLLEHHADPRIGLSQNNTSPLIRAIADGAQSIVQKIINVMPQILNDESSFTAAGFSPLHAAVQENQLAMVSLFLDRGAKIDALEKGGVTAVFIAAQNGFVEILRALLQRQANYELSFFKDSNGETVSPLEKAARNGHIECVRLLLMYPHPQKTLEKALHYSFSNALTAQQKQRQDLYVVSELIKNQLDKKPVLQALTLEDSKILTWEESYESMVSTKPSEKEKQPYDKNSAIRSALVSIYHLLTDPQSCIDYLKLLNDALYYHWENEYGSPFPNFDSAMITIRMHQRISWPIPNDDFQGIKKFKLLDRIILDKFKQYEMGDKQNQWTGFIPKKKSREMLTENVLFTENGNSINGLFHGNMHNIQRVILLFAMERGAIPLTYIENNELKKLKPKEIFSALMSRDIFATDKPHAPVWINVMDGGRENYFSFTFPYHLHSFLLTNTETCLSTLKSYMLFSFCAKYIQLLRLHNHVYSTNYDTKIFFRELSKLAFDTFTGNPEFAIQIKEKRNLSTIPRIDDLAAENRREWSVIPKQYTPLTEHVKMHGNNIREANLFFATNDKNTVASRSQSEAKFKNTLN